MRFSGKAWRLGDNIDTDVMTPGALLQLGMKQLSKQVLKAVRPELAEEFAPGDLILAGRNFGCGSSREQAPAALKELGVSVIVARSFARIFYRNCLAIGLPVAILDPRQDSHAAADAIADRHEVTVDLEGSILDPLGDAPIPLKKTPPEVLDLLRKGGIVPLIQAIAQAQKGA